MELKEQEKKRKITTTQAPGSLLGLICTFLAYAILIFGVVKGINKRGGFQKRNSISNEDIYRKLEDLESKVEFSTRIQKFGIVYAIGAAFAILGFSQWPGLLERLGIDTTRYYAYSIFYILIGSYTMIIAFFISRQKKNKGK